MYKGYIECSHGILALGLVARPIIETIVSQLLNHHMALIPDTRLC